MGALLSLTERAGPRAPRRTARFSFLELQYQPSNILFKSLRPAEHKPKQGAGGPADARGMLYIFSCKRVHREEKNEEHKHLHNNPGKCKQVVNEGLTNSIYNSKEEEQICATGKLKY